MLCSNLSNTISHWRQTASSTGCRMASLINRWKAESALLPRLHRWRDQKCCVHRNTQETIGCPWRSTVVSTIGHERFLPIAGPPSSDWRYHPPEEMHSSWQDRLQWAIMQPSEGLSAQWPGGAPPLSRCRKVKLAATLWRGGDDGVIDHRCAKYGRSERILYTSEKAPIRAEPKSKPGIQNDLEKHIDAV